MLLSPFTDLTISRESYATRAAVDPWNQKATLELVARAYLKGASPREPHASPLFADLRGLPPLLVQVGDREVVLDDSRDLATAARAAGVDVTLEVHERMIHVFQQFAADVPEAAKAIATIGTFPRPSLEPSTMSDARSDHKNSPIGILGYGGYLPRMRLERSAVGQANAWFAPGFASKKGTRSFANWDEDSITMAVARRARLPRPGRGPQPHLKGVTLASSRLPFAERMNSGIVAEALTLDDDLETLDLTGSQRAALAGLAQALAKASSPSASGEILVLAADDRQTRPASAAELEVGDGGRRDARGPR